MRGASIAGARAVPRLCACTDDAGTTRSLRRRNARLELLDDRPAQQLSLRDVADRLGVSHQAPYVHFATKRVFFAAVAGAGLERAARQAAASVDDAGDDPVARLHGLVAAYLAFARERSHVHDRAFGPLVAKADHPRLQLAAIDYWELLRRTVQACQPLGVTEQELLRRCVAVWGTVQGITRLDGYGQIPVSVPGEIDDLLHEAVDALLLGWGAASPRP